jgi:precorrin-2 dehydrogenase/sirohydrochlorin ferrochelatase
MMLDVGGRRVVIIGGGKVATRKAQGLIEAGAAVRCVAPQFCNEMPAGIERVAEEYQSRHLDGAMFVFAATDRADVNEAVVRDARARGLLVNRADAETGEPGDFITPAVHRLGSVVVTVSAGSPALAALVRDRLGEACDTRWGEMAQLMQELRPMIKSAGSEAESRRQILRELATPEALDVLASGGPSAVRQWLLSRHPELNHA